MRLAGGASTATCVSSVTSASRSSTSTLPTGLRVGSVARTATARIQTYKRVEADPHNLWPAIATINSSRGKKLFGEIPGERRTLPRSIAADSICDYERTATVVEPRRAVRGDIARLLFYMHVEYELNLKGMMPMLKRWNAKDPPNAHERWRNNQIERLQAIETGSLMTGH
jgi:deoxyribonuclease-1